MTTLEAVTTFCDERVRRREIADFPGAENGLQFANGGEVTKIGAAVDAGLVPFREAIGQGVDFLIVHHGMYWSPSVPVTGHKYEKQRMLFEGNLAVYGSHLPLDAHPEIGNNACIAAALKLPVLEWFLEHEGTPIALICEAPPSRHELADRLKGCFPETFTAIEFGSEKPKRVAILSGSGRSAIEPMQALGVDTLITGELRQQHFNLAQESQLNLYPCGHYATEVFGVQALAKEVAEHFGLPWCFIPTTCPL